MVVELLSAVLMRRSVQWLVHPTGCAALVPDSAVLPPVRRAAALASGLCV